MSHPNRYFKYSNEEGTLGRGFGYIEFAPFDHKWVALRQVEADGEKFLSSNLPTQMLGLCDKPMATSDFEFALSDLELPSIEISVDEFEEVWNRAMCATTQSWHEFKIALPAGSVLPANPYGYYPQGVLAKIDGPFFGLLEYIDFQNQVGDLRHQVQTRVIGFDEKYRWALLGLVAK